MAYLRESLTSSYRAAAASQRGLAAAEHLITIHGTHSQSPPIVTLCLPVPLSPAAQQAPEEDFYQLLGVPRDAPPDLIKKQYYILARRYCNFDFI